MPARALVLSLLPLLTLASPYDWRSYPNGGRAVRYELAGDWLLLEGAPTAGAIEGALLKASPDAVLARIERLVVGRTAVQIGGLDTDRLRDLGAALVRDGVTAAAWPAAKRESGVGFFDDGLAVALDHRADVVRLVKLGVRPVEQPLPGVWRMRAVDGDGIGAAWRLQGVAGVRWAEPDLIRHVETYDLPNDPQLGLQWHLDNANDVGDIDIEAAWEVTRGRAEVVVGIFDNGFDLDHPDLVPNIVGGFDAAGGDANPEAECSSVADGAGPAGSCPAERPFRESHGTAVAGVVAARGDNELNGAGVCPECSLYTVRLLGTGFRSISNAAAFQRGADAGVWVVNNSWGPGLTRFFPLSDAERETFSRITMEARDGKGVVLVFAAGNDFFTPATANPYAANRGVVTVSASTRIDDFACYSNYGSVIAVSGPSRGCFDGESGIATTDYVGREGYAGSDFTQGFGGTSAASPVVAGVAALILAANPELTAQQVRLVLQRSAEKIRADQNPWEQRYGIDLETEFEYDEHGFSKGFGYGRVNAGQAVAIALQVDDQVAAVCDDACPRCYEGRCAPDCAADAECPAASRCLEMPDGGRGCAIPRPAVDEAGQPCGADCELCVDTVDSRFDATRVCTVSCASDDECPFGFDCRTIDPDSPKACVPGNQECGSVWGDERCQSEIRVEGGGAEFCSCECIPNTAGSCPDGFLCSNVFCERRRGAILCTAVDSRRDANYFTSCVPDPAFEAPCEAHTDCTGGLFCIDGTCQADRFDGGCDICAPCVRSRDCNNGEACVTLLRGPRCLLPCDENGDTEACPGDSVCSNLPGPDGLFCVNPEFRRKGYCPNAYRCEVEGRCVEDEDCAEGSECVVDLCRGPNEPVPDMAVDAATPDAAPEPEPDAAPDVDPSVDAGAPDGGESTRKSDGCNSSDAPAAWWFALAVAATLRRRGRVFQRPD